MSNAQYGEIGFLTPAGTVSADLKEDDFCVADGLERSL
jgi:hypothetical protein